MRCGLSAIAELLVSLLLTLEPLIIENYSFRGTNYIIVVRIITILFLSAIGAGPLDSEPQRRWHVGLRNWPVQLQ